MPARKRILFVAESVTLAQVVRLVTLARGLDAETHEVHFASGAFPELVFEGTQFVRHALRTLSPATADAALRSGRRLYEKATLLAYIADEIRLIEAVRPELVVGDFRLTLSTSAELVGVPSAALINAYWSPFARREAFPVPDHPVVRWLGEERTERYFPRALPAVFRHFAQPVNAARQHHGLSDVGSLLEVLTHADYVLYPDDPALTPAPGAPASHRFLGPILWQPAHCELGSLANGPLESDGPPIVYATLGSSGALELMPLLLEVLSSFRVRGVVATAGRVELGAVPSNVIALPFVRGSELARRARVVVTNGGSSSGYQALWEGTPVLGLPSNLDQYLASQAIVRAGAGIQVKARTATRELLGAALERALADEAMQTAARDVASHFRAHDSAATFRTLVEAIASSAFKKSNAAESKPESGGPRVGRRPHRSSAAQT